MRLSLPLTCVVLAACVHAERASAQVTCQNLNGITYCSNGLQGQQLNGIEYWNNGVTRQRLNGIDYYSQPAVPNPYLAPSIPAPDIYEMPRPRRGY